MNAPLDENRLEAVTVEYFRALGYGYVHGPSIAPDGDTPERTNDGQAVLFGRLRDALRRINPGMPDEGIRVQVGRQDPESAQVLEGRLPGCRLHRCQS